MGVDAAGFADFWVKLDSIPGSYSGTGFERQGDWLYFNWEVFQCEIYDFFVLFRSMGAGAIDKSASDFQAFEGVGEEFFLLA